MKRNDFMKNIQECEILDKFDGSSRFYVGKLKSSFPILR